MRAGFDERDITPTVGMERPGNYAKVLIGSTHDRLKVRAAVFGNGADRIALIGVDTLTISERTVAEARAEIHRRCGITGDRVLVAASHTHSGGPLFGYFASDFTLGSPELRHLAVDLSTVIDPGYHAQVISSITDAVARADGRACSGSMSYDLSCVHDVSFNRRFVMRDGSIHTHPGKGNPHIVRPAGPVDRELSVLGWWREDGSLIGCIVSFPCHGTTDPGGTSADWVYYLERTVRAAFGDHVIVVFLNGACGDVTQINNISQREREIGERWTRIVGTRVGSEAVRLLAGAHPEPAPELIAARRVVIDIPRRRPSSRRIDEAKAILASVPPPNAADEWADDPETTRWVMAKELVVLDYVAQNAPRMSVEIQAIRLGRALYVANPGECFSETGLAIKSKSQFPGLTVVTMANGAVGYVPPQSAFGSIGGGYETVLTSYSNLVCDAEERIVTKSLELVCGFAHPKPRNDPTPTITKPWTYGGIRQDIG